MEHSEVVVTAAEPDLDDALARAIRQLIRGAMSADADAYAHVPRGQGGQGGQGG